MYANRFWRVLVQADRVFKIFRARFAGKCSPVHFFWGAGDLAVTRFSGRPAPEHPGGIPNLPDRVTREAYSHEVSSAGFWAGGGPVAYPAFYSYAYPEPAGFAKAPVRPEGAFYSRIFASSSCPTTSCASRRRPTTRCSSSCSPLTRPRRCWRRGIGRRSNARRRRYSPSAGRRVRRSRRFAFSVRANESERTRTMKAYLLSLPERLVRSVLGLGAGVAREVGEVAVPAAIRRGRLYQNLVDATLQFLIEQVGGVEGVYTSGDRLPDNFLVRRTAGNAVEALGIVAFRASPVWVLAALADVCGMGRHLIPEIADALKAQGLLEKDAHFTSVEQMLDGLERTSARLASTINTPPLDVPALREEWQAIRDDARGLAPASLPSRDTIVEVWTGMKAASAREERSIFETSSAMAVAAVKGLPEGVRWLSASAVVGAARTGQVVARIAARLLQADARRAAEGRVRGLHLAADAPVSAGGGRAVLARTPHPDPANPR